MAIMWYKYLVIENAKHMETKQNLFQKHGTYFATINTISIYLAGIVAFFRLVQQIVFTVYDNNMLGFVILVIFSGVWQTVNGIMYYLIIYAALTIITFFPYVIIRGIVK